MVFLKNTATRVGHSIVWGSRYSPRFAKMFQQVSFWLTKLVETSFFSRKFKHASVIYSHVVINGFERFIFLTIFVYDGLLVALLYSLYRLIVTSKFFRRFSVLFRRRPLSFPLSSSLSSLSSHTLLTRLKKTRFVSKTYSRRVIRPYYGTYYSKVSLFFSRLLPRKHLVFGWKFFKKRFSYFRLLQLQASQYFRFSKKPVRAFTYAQKIRSFLRLFFRNFSFFRKFKILGFHVLRQVSEFPSKGISFLVQKVFRHSVRYERYKNLLFSAFLHEFFSKILFYVFKTSKTSQFKKSVHYNYLTIFFNKPPRRSRFSFRLYRKRLFQSVKSHHRTSQFQGRVSFTPLLFFFQRYLRRLKHKYRFYMRNPTYFFNYSTSYFLRRRKYASRRRRRRVFFRTRKFYKYYARRPGFRFGLKRFRRAHYRRRRLLEFANERAFKKSIRSNNSASPSASVSNITKPSSSRSLPSSRKSTFSADSSSPKTFKSLFGNVKLLKSASKPSRSFSSFVEKFKIALTTQRHHLDTSSSTLPLQLSSNSLSTNNDSSNSTNLSSLKSAPKPLQSSKRFLKKDFSTRLWYWSKNCPPLLRREIRQIIRYRRYRKFALRRSRNQLRARTLRTRIFFKRKRRRRFIKFNAFNFNNLLVGNLYKKILTVIFKRNMLGRRAFYDLFRTWLSLSFGRLFSFFSLFCKIVLIFPINLRANILAKYITKKLEFHYSLNELVYPILKTLRPFFKGFRLRASGRFSRAQRASIRKFSFGKIAFSTLGNSLSYIFRWTRLKYGVCSVKLWLLPKLNPFFRKNFYQRQLDRNFRLITFDTFFNSYAQQILQDTLEKFKFFQCILQNLLRIRIKNKLIQLMFESIKLKFYRFKHKLNQFIFFIHSKSMCTMFIFYSFSFFNKSSHSFFFFDILGTRIISKYFHFRRKPFWAFSLIASARLKPKFMWSLLSSKKPIKRFAKKFLRFRRVASSTFIPLRYGSH